MKGLGSATIIAPTIAFGQPLATQDKVVGVFPIASSVPISWRSTGASSRSNGSSRRRSGSSAGRPTSRPCKPTELEASIRSGE